MSKGLELYAYDPEVEKTFHLLKRTRIQSEHAPEPELEHHRDHSFDFVSLDSSSKRRRRRKMSSHNHFSYHSSVVHLRSLDTCSPHSNNMDNMTLKELVAPDVTYQPLCIQYPELDIDFELKFGLINL